MSNHIGQTADKERARRQRDLFRATALLLMTVLFESHLSAQADNPAAQNSCQFDVKQLGRNAQTSPELIQLESRLVEPDVPISQRLIIELAERSAADATHIPPQPFLAESDRLSNGVYSRKYDEAIAKYLDVLVYLVSEKTGEAQIETFMTAAENQFLRALPMQPPVPHCFQEIAAEVFPKLPFQEQWGILMPCDSCDLFRSPTLTAYWVHLYDSLETHIEETPSDQLERSLRFYRTGILKRIYEADPVLGRKMILQEIASSQPRCDIDALRLLPEETLPAMDALFAQQLPGIYVTSDASEYQAKLAVIERYATGTILPEMKLLYSNDPDERNPYQLPLFLSYFLRTDPALAGRLIESSLKEPGPESVLFTDLDKIRPQPALQELAREHLSDPDKIVAANAASIFKYEASDTVAPLLWLHLEAWHKEWAGKQASIPYEEQNYGDSLVEALLFGNGPCKTRDTLERLKALYIRGESVDGNIDLPDWHSPIRITFQGFRTGEPKFDMDFCSGPLTLEQLKSAIPRFPKKTQFEWYGSWHPLLDEKIQPSHDEIKRYIERSGMILRQHVPD